MDPVLVHPIYVKRGTVKCACVIGDGKYAAAGSSLGSVLLFPLDQSVQPNRLTGHTEAVTCIDSNSTGIVVSGSADATVKVWRDTANQTLRPNAGIIRAVSVAENEPLALVIGEDEPPSIWNTNTAEVVATLPEHASEITCGAISPDGTLCITGSNDGACRLFDTHSGKQVRAFKASDGVASIAFCEHIPIAAAGCIDGYVTIFDYKQNEITVESQLHEGIVTSVSFHPYLPMILSGSDDKQIVIATAPNLKVVYTLGAHKDAVRCVKWSPSGDKFVSCGDDKGVFVWSSPSEEAILEPEEEEEEKEREEEEFKEDPEVSFQVQRAKKEKEHQNKKMEMMNLILEKVRELAGTLQAMEQRMKTIDSTIEQIEKVQSEDKRIVRRSKK